MNEDNDVKTCEICGQEFLSFAGTSRGLAFYDDKEPLVTGGAEHYVKWFDLCWDCAKVFDQVAKDLL